MNNQPSTHQILDTPGPCQNVKARVARQAVADEHELAAAMHRSMRRLQKRPDIVRAFFADPHLAYISP
ncbi:hypothetical protein J2853_007818 [Streptosporangium lutulentum]|uniref:Uncharacterized protein n=1 Tax=Streptosporangium lutulentum TaxID=1461250 RepID=A0ABT9QPB6_9ACTN|nr:hypothetical protein [Streptosporangium lutulentum]MDP9848607.1 hypothetical protein [Streptosporangium lutulentum]